MSEIPPPAPEGSTEIRTGVQPTAVPKLRSLPPLDPTTHSLSSTRIPTKEVRTPAPRPVLASECLRDDIAPIEPHDRRTAVWQISVGAALIAVGAAMFLKIAPSRSTLDAVLPAAGGALLVLPVAARQPYAVRAGVALAVAVSLLVLGLLGIGPGVRGTMHASLDVIRVLAPIWLATALFLRSTYRASRTTRVGIGTGIVLYLVAGAWAGGMAIWSSDVSLVSRLVAGAMVLVSALSLLGFMSEETTGACNVWGAAVLTLASIALGLDAVRTGFDRHLANGAFVSAMAMTAAAIAAYQIGALLIGPLARHKENERASLPPSRPAEERRKLESIPPLDE